MRLTSRWKEPGRIKGAACILTAVARGSQPEMSRQFSPRHSLGWQMGLNVEPLN